MTTLAVILFVAADRMSSSEVNCALTGFLFACIVQVLTVSAEGTLCQYWYLLAEEPSTNCFRLTIGLA